MRLVGLFTVDEPELTLSQLTERMGTTRPTTHRYTMALREAGLLRFDQARGVYSLGARLVELAASALSGLQVSKIALPHVERLATTVEETALLSIWNGHAPIVVVVADSPTALARITIAHGTALPLTSASGRLFAAFRVGRQAGTDGRELDQIRDARFAADRELVKCIRTIAAPVFQVGEMVGALAIVGTTAAIPETLGAHKAARLRNAADDLTSELGLNEDAI